MRLHGQQRDTKVSMWDTNPKPLKDVFGRDVKNGDVVMYPSGNNAVMAIGVVAGRGYAGKLRLIDPYRRTVQRYIHGLGYIELGVVTDYQNIYLERLDRIVKVDIDKLDLSKEDHALIIDLSNRLEKYAGN